MEPSTPCPPKPLLDHPPFTVRRNPSRRARPQTPFSLPDPSTPEPLNVFLRIRPPNSPDRKRCPKRPLPMKEQIVLVRNGVDSVTLSAPPSLVDSRRGRSEAYDGFAHVFGPESDQEEVFERVMEPLVRDFLEGRSGLLAAMGPTGSGKTHTMFGCPREPGMLPLALRKIFRNNDGDASPRFYLLSMFEICSERGTGEKIVDLSPGGTNVAFQMSTIKGLQKVMVSTVVEAECLIARATLRRATASTNANARSSRSQFVINIRHASSNLKDAALTVVDLAGAEREGKSGTQGKTLAQSNFINNTSMTFGLCLRALLEHQQNPKKSLKKHFQNSLLTRYLKEYLEGKKRMTLILTVKPGVNDYHHSSFLLRQAAPYMKIKFNIVEQSTNIPPKKRVGVSSGRLDLAKRKKYGESEVDGAIRRDRSAPRKDANRESDVLIEPACDPLPCQESEASFSDGAQTHTTNKKDIIWPFSRALWNVLKEYKKKLKVSELEIIRLKECLKVQETRNTILEDELHCLKSQTSVSVHSAVEISSHDTGDRPSTSSNVSDTPKGGDSKKAEDDDIYNVAELFAGYSPTGPLRISCSPLSLTGNIKSRELSSSATLEGNQSESVVNTSQSPLTFEESENTLVAEQVEEFNGEGESLLTFEESENTFVAEQVEEFNGEVEKDAQTVENSHDLALPGSHSDPSSTTSLTLLASVDHKRRCLTKQMNLRNDEILSSKDTNKPDQYQVKWMPLKGVNVSKHSAPDKPDNGQVNKTPLREENVSKHSTPDKSNEYEVKRTPLKEENVSRHLAPDKPRRRLLPASAMLLNEFTRLDMEAENCEEALEKKEPLAEGRQRSHGSISLVGLLRNLSRK